MTTSTLTPHRKAVVNVASFKAAASADGTFEAVVSVFGNVDFAGERVQRGAFTRTLEEWAASGDPIPVIFSHRWDDLDAHIGVVVEAAELAPGDDRLTGTGLEANGGLWVRGAIDLEEPYAARVFTLLDRRSLKEFSFAFDVAPNGARMASDGVVDLVDLNLFEVGPTLKGMNPDTALMGTKTLRLANVSGLEPTQVLVEALLAGLELDGPTVDADVAAVKATGRPTGSLEDTFLDPLREAITAWAADAYGGDLYAVHLDGTFPDEERVVVIAERWQDPLGEGPLWELHYSIDDAGAVAIGAAQEVDAVITVEPKAAKLAAAKRSGAGGMVVGFVTDGPLPAAKSTAPAKVLDDILRAELDLASD